MSNSYSPYSRLVALLLCWFLGGLGAHRFYVGKWKSALVMLILPVIIVVMFVAAALGIASSPQAANGLGFAALGVLVIPLWGLGLWVFVDLIMILLGAFTDSQGRRVFRWMDAGST